jgi:hypothetical protein
LGFICECKKANMFFVFLESINDENKSASKSVGKMFLMIKIGSLVYTLIKLWWH